MATYYVNGSGGNYTWVAGPAAGQTSPAGNDSAPGDGSIAHPWATMTKAEAAAAATNTVYVAAATYAENDGTFHCLSTAKAITWIADGTVIVKPYSSTSYCAVIGGTSAATTFNGFTFDATKVNGATNAATAIHIPTNSTNKVFTNCTAKEAVTQLINFSAAGGVTAHGLTLANTGAAIVGINAGAAGASTVTVTGLAATGTYSRLVYVVGDTGAWSFTSGGTISISLNNKVFDFQAGGNWEISGHNVTLAGTPSSFLSAATAGKTGSITANSNVVTYNGVVSAAPIINVSNGGHNCSFDSNQLTAKSASQAQTGIYTSLASGTPTVSITNNVVDFNGTTSSSTAFGPIICRSAGATYAPTITGNTVKTTQTGGFGIQEGTDSDATVLNNLVDGGTISGNFCYGPFYYNRAAATNGTHGIEAGWNKNITISKNYINGFGYGVVVKGSIANSTYTSGGVISNLIVNCSGTAISAASYIRLKGVVSVPVYGNTIYLDAAYLGPGNGFIELTQGDVASDKCTGCLIKNNIIFGKDGSNFIKVANDDSTLLVANCNYNLYWNQTSAASADFVYQATTYTSFADWVAAGYDANSPTSANPAFVSSSDYHLQVSSPAKYAGVNLSLGTDYAGVAYAVPPSIGAYEYPVPSPVTYYVDTTRPNNSGDGKSEAAAKQTISTAGGINSLSLNPGDTIKFRCGQVWREQLLANYSGESGSPITYTSYQKTGAGDPTTKPLISGGTLLTSWDGAGPYTKASTGPASWLLEDGVSLPKASSAGNVGIGAGYDGNWFYDGATVTYQPTTGTPANHDVEVFNRASAVTFTADGAWIVFDGLAVNGRVGIYASYSHPITNLTIRNCDVKHTGQGIWVGCKNGVNGGPYTLTGNTFDYCGNSIYVVSSQDLASTNTATITNNTTAHAFSTGAGSFTPGNWYPEIADAEAFALQNLVNSTVNNNTFSGGDLYCLMAIDLWTGTGVAATGTEVAYNFINGMKGFGIVNGGQDQGHSNAFIHHNIIRNCGLGSSPPYGGIRLNNAQLSTTPSTVYNNTIIGCDIGIYLNSLTDYYKIRNNIVYNCTYNMRSNQATVGNNLLDHNNYYNASPNYYINGSDNQTLADWKTWGGGVQDADVIILDPLFSNPAGTTATDFELQAGSPVAITGVNVGLTLDYNGLPVPNGAGLYSIGAWQFQGSAVGGRVPPRIINLGDTGTMLIIDTSCGEVLIINL